jgi:energy-coupling factor transporter ATP-binding protein EcfA2
MAPLVSVRNLSFRYSGASALALSAVNFEIESGEFVLLTGPSGSGKSTLLRAMNGLVPHFYGGDFSGEVRVGGVNTKNSEVSKLAEISGLVFSDPESQLVSLDVESDVAFGPQNLGLEKCEILNRVNESISQVGIENLRHKPPHELSGGEQQKAAVASILSIRPKILVLDEPAANLDPLSATSLMELLGELNSKGTTVLIAEHRTTLVAPYASRVLAMDSGRLLASGTPREVFTSGVLNNLGIEIPAFYAIAQELTHRGLALDGARNIQDILNVVEGRKRKND